MTANRTARGLCPLLSAAWLLLAALPAQPSPFAHRVLSFDDKGKAGGGIFDPQNLLGPIDGAVHSLGIGGNAVLGFAVTIADGPGSDFIVSENPFFSGPPFHTFAEVAFVEVSTNGVDFARFPARYFGPAVQPGPFGVIHLASYENLAGATPVNLLGDPRDVVEAGGDAFDLQDLRDDPLVKSGKVDLQAIHYLRLVDVQSGIDKDHQGRTVFDPGGGSTDIDGIAVIHHTQSSNGRPPAVDVVIQPNGDFALDISDPDGIGDLDPGSLRWALNGIALDFAVLFGILRITRADAHGFRMELMASLPPEVLLRIAASVKDRAGNRAGDVRSRPLPNP